ncbi:MAG: NADH-quinone oxidoreductase subunit L, partial [Candidatus Omnitrophica bacterium]|nr:NADH-quinone oxidoreductase subunit L [Candidatus Omnitrophota bacterium]
KALLFLGAGSVIHGTGIQDIREMGGLFRKMKSTAMTFIIAALAISGVPPLSGFWSKDEILVTAYESGATAVYWILLGTAFMTAFYMFRLVFLTFFGQARNPEIHAHESPTVMTLPLWILAAGSIVIGWPGSSWMHHWFQNFLGPGIAGIGGYGHAKAVVHPEVMTASMVAGASGIILAALIYLGNPGWAEGLSKVFRLLYQVSFNKFWIDEIYSVGIVQPFHALARILFHFDLSVIDGAVNGTGSNTLLGSRIQNWIDQYIVDGVVNFVGLMTRFTSAVLRRIQTGLIQSYLLLVCLGLLILILFEMK